MAPHSDRRASDATDDAPMTSADASAAPAGAAHRPTGEFQEAMALQAAGDGRWVGAVRPGWDILGNANGGYLMAIAGTAMSNEVGRAPLTLTAHYLAPAPDGPCEVDVEVVRAGRRKSTVSATLRIAGRDTVRLLGLFGDAVDDEPLLVDGAPPELPPIEECQSPDPAAGGFVPEFTQRVVLAMRPGDEGFRNGSPTGRAEFAGWFALRDETPLTPAALLLASDAFPPPLFNLAGPVGWVPTLELTVHLRGVPAPGPLACTFRSRFAQGGMVEEDGELWDSAGRLVAQCRQLALLPRA